MNYANNELRNKLAAEYVIGTLHGKARLRFERLMQKDIKLRKYITHWEQQLNPLNQVTKSITPTKHIWQAILSRIQPHTYKTPSVWQRLNLWRSVSVAATAAVMILTVQLINVIQTEPVAQYQYVTLLANEQAKAAWIVRVYQQTGKMTVQALNAQEPGFKKAFELWMLPDGQAPRSLGLIPVSGERTITLSDPLARILNNSKALAVSLEPENGSPTGAPTGPVLYQGKKLAI